MVCDFCSKPKNNGISKLCVLCLLLEVLCLHDYCSKTQVLKSNSWPARCSNYTFIETQVIFLLKHATNCNHLHNSKAPHIWYRIHLHSTSRDCCLINWNNWRPLPACMALQKLGTVWRVFPVGKIMQLSWVHSKIFWEFTK